MALHRGDARRGRFVRVPVPAGGVVYLIGSLVPPTDSFVESVCILRPTCGGAAPDVDPRGGESDVDASAVEDTNYLPEVKRVGVPAAQSCQQIQVLFVNNRGELQARRRLRQL